MSTSSTSGSAEVRRKKQTVGAIAIALVALFAILLFFKVLNLIYFFIADLVVYLAANYIFRRLDRQISR
jgi:hypothetical protein